MLRTWDIFDTLIARRCISPQAVFQIVEQVSKINGFVKARIAAEKVASSQGSYWLDDIYAEFQKLTGASQNICDNLKKLECDVELNQCIPITENLRKVKSGDILLSDMYLPENFIRKMLSKAGLQVPVEIVVTTAGKSSGRIWQQLAAQKKFLFHTGDNFNSDVKNSRLFGFESMLTILSNSTGVEQYLLQKDSNFGAYLREIRLRNPFSEEIKRIYWQLFTINIGLLILFVAQLDAIQKKCGFEYLGFCGRDTHWLRLLYEKYKSDLGEKPTPNDYLYYSRKLVRNSGEDLAEYFSAKIDGRKALMIDMVGSGTNLNYLREKFKLDYSLLICCYNGKGTGKNYFPDVELPKNWIVYPNTQPPADKDKLNMCFLDFKSPKKFFPNVSIENLNRAPHNSPVRLKTFKIDGKILPEVVLSETNDAENFDVLESCFKEVMDSKLVTSTYASRDGGKNFADMALTLIKILNSSVVQVPLRNNHLVTENMDNAMIGVFNHMSARKK